VGDGERASSVAGDASATEVVAPRSSPVGLQLDDVDLSAAALRGAGSWRPALRAYERPDWRSGFQLLTAAATFVLGWWLAVRALEIGYLLALLPAVLISVATMRMFIIFHDCGHGSFSRSKRTNDVVGTVLGIFVFTPFRYWNYAHAMHHATSSDLDRRGWGDVWTMTVDEYAAATRRRRFGYRAYHSTPVVLTVGPLLKFLLIERFVERPTTTPLNLTNDGVAWFRRPAMRRSIHVTNAGIAAYVVVMTLLVGPAAFVAIQLPVLIVTGGAAISLFTVQHLFEGAYWARRDGWQYVDSAMRGSSHLDLGRVGRYVTGNIGFHHLHHLDARIPNYNLPRCSRERTELRAGSVLTLRDAVRARRLKLWDERRGCYVGFDAVVTAPASR
jgi:acyl-lipid omega-6 desaturase (Delta-12 desaturase)